MKRNLLQLVISGFIFIPFFVVAQNQTDSIPVKILPSVLIKSSRIPTYLPNVMGMGIYSGKKTNQITLSPGSTNMAQNSARQAFAQVPGLNVWEMDGSGTQINIGTRGTDTHRSIEMNMRQNGYNTNSDIFGYPEDHYTPPMQGIREIQYVKGSAALQFGSQFGGMVNFLMKEGDSTKSFSLESEQTAGSYNFFNSYNAVGGKVGKVTYYAYYDNRHGDGWRPNSAFNYGAFFSNIRYQFDPKGNISFQFSRMDARTQIAGGLTDDQFNQLARQSNRARNYFNPVITIPAINFQYIFSPRTRVDVTSHQLVGQRNSVQFINTPNVADTVNTSIGSYNPRQVDRDYYNGFTTEARVLHRFSIGTKASTLIAGGRYFEELTDRRQKGVGTTGSDFDLSLVKPYGIDLHLHTQNAALFAEDLFELTHRFSITPGMRLEFIETHMDGVVNNASVPVSYKKFRRFPLFGTGLQYLVNDHSQLYGNFSQAYRPFLYANITPANQIGIIDPNTKDSRGYSADLGYRGQLSNLVRFDVSAFYVYYGDRIGQLTLANPANAIYLYTTNIGNAVSKGVEAFVDVSLWRLVGNNSPYTDLRLFNSLGFNHARYISGPSSYNGESLTIVGHHMEGVPDWINRSGLQFQFHGISTSLQWSFVGKNFSDANNTTFNKTGAVGVVPRYQVWDWAFNWSFLKNYRISAGVNNLANATYFTRRINMYPGPGILPADGRTVYLSLGFKL
jgi:Fe(3+) dicitrate transport protein